MTTPAAPSGDMTTPEISAELARLHDAVVERGYVCSTVYVMVRTPDDTNPLAVHFRHCLPGSRGPYSDDDVFVPSYGDTMREAFAVAFGKAAALPRPHDLRVAKLTAKLREAAVEAEALGYAEAFINPIVALAEKMATNAIPHRED